MTGRLEDIRARLETVGQLDAVITAMRSIAAARAREAQAQLDGIETYARTIGAAISAVLPMLPEPPPAPARRGAPADLVIALTAEQGFAGSFSAQVLTQARAHRANGGTGELLLVGDCGLSVAAEMGFDPAWSVPMAAHVDEIPALADRIAGAAYTRLAVGRALTVSLIHARPDRAGGLAVIDHPLLPFDYSRFPAGAHAVRPLVSLPPPQLAELLAEEHVFAELCAALMLSCAAENEARMRAMIGARGNVRRTRETLNADYRRLRQEHITTEIVKLAAGRTAKHEARGGAS